MFFTPENFIEGKPLDPVLTGGINDLSKDGKKQLNELAGPRPFLFVYKILENWMIILSVFYLISYIDSYYFYPIAICLISSRQNIFGLLVHEQTHF